MPLEPASGVRAHVVGYQYAAFAVIRRKLAEIFGIRCIAYPLPVHLKHKSKAGAVAVLRWNGSQHYNRIRRRNFYHASRLHHLQPFHFFQLLLGNRRLAAAIAIDYALRCYEKGEFSVLLCNTIYDFPCIRCMVWVHVGDYHCIQVCRLLKQALPCQKRSRTRVDVDGMPAKADDKASAVLAVLQVFPAASCPQEMYAPL